mmetsp:Transcript_19741/g.46785  ORF Transcript_19741/g.46785 Transcript_19741/m.46785 type:complete len:240 (+) Transcript_19741:544-1263(+)
MTSMSSSGVASQLMRTLAETMEYSLRMTRMPSSSRCVRPPLTEVEKLRPPLSFFVTTMAGGFLLSRMPTPSSSRSMIRLWSSGFMASRTMMIQWHVRAVEMTCRPRPLPSLAPSMIPGRSSSWILAPLWWITPGMQVSVVNSYEAASEKIPVSEVSSVDFPTDGKPTKPTRASPVAFTSKPSPVPCAPDLGASKSSSRLYRASFALRPQMCAIVCLLICVRAISSSMSLIFPTRDDMPP